jgi:hypothetical protein
MTGTGIDRRLLVVPVLVLALAALIGYLAGHRPARAAPQAQALTASVGGVLLNAPPQWHVTSSAQEIPGLAVSHPVVLAPGGDASQAGLLAGTLPAGQGSPLPSQLLARLSQRPTTSVVSLQEAQAYRYTGLSIPGFGRSVTVYVVPNPGGDSTALACYAAPVQSSEMQACERSVATLTLTGHSQTYDLSPQPEYAQRLSAPISSLNAQRLALRGQMRTGVSPGGLQRVAAQLERAFAQTAATLSGLEPTLATGQAQSALSGAILRARSAYATLATAAGDRNEGRFAAARSQVERAEAGVDRALEGFTLLGYRAA